MQAKTKVSVSVQTSLLREVERAAGDMTRSAIFEKALADWLRERRRTQLDRAVESYYRSLTVPEVAEDNDWATLGDDTVRRSWSSQKR